MRYFLLQGGTVMLAVAATYAVLTLLVSALTRLRLSLARRDAGRRRAQRPVSVLKPLCGAEPGLYRNLRSFCLQDYPDYQIIFGVRDPADPALEVVSRLRREFPGRDIAVVVSGRQHGSNAKVSNLINMLSRARHELVLISDSDVLAGSDFLAVITKPLGDPSIGLATCLYQSNPTAGLCSELGARFVNDWYVPSIVLAHFFGHRRFASGVALCLERQTLAKIGGLAGIADHIADDYRLGQLINGLGRRIALVPHVARMEHHESSWTGLLAHMVRWMTTLRTLQPLSYPFLCVTFSVPFAIAGLGMTLVGGASPHVSVALLAVTATARLLLAALPPLGGGVQRRPFWAAPLADALLCWAWWRALLNSRVHWRGLDFEVDQRGILRHTG